MSEWAKAQEHILRAQAVLDEAMNCRRCHGTGRTVHGFKHCNVTLICAWCKGTGKC